MRYPSNQPEGCCFHLDRCCCCGLRSPEVGCWCWTLLPLLVFLCPQLPRDSVEVPRADRRALYIASPSVSMTPAGLSPSRNVVAILWACDMRCGSRSGPEHCAMIGELRSHCSELLSAAVSSRPPSGPNLPDPRNTQRSSMSSNNRHRSSA